MKNYLLLFSALVLIFSSCSSSRYGYVPKGNKNTAKIVKHKSKYSKANESKKEIVYLGNKKAIAKTGNAEVKLNLPAFTPLKRAEKMNHKVEVKTNKPTENFVLSPTAIDKVLKISGQHGLEKVQAERSWLYYLLVGLILLLVASLLAGLIGYIFYVAGVIALILAILALFGII